MEPIDAQQELAFIRKVMADSRTAISDDGKGLIVWGTLVVAGMVTMYASFQFGYPISKTLLWAVLIGLGWVYTIFHEMQNRKTKRFSTFGGRIVGSLWLGCGVVMTIVGFLSPMTGALKPWAIIPVSSLVIGIGYLVTGVVYDDRWTRFSALGWWAGAIVMMLWPGYYLFLLFSAMMIIFQIVPGVRLYQQWRLHQTSEGR
jgi:hypothetical protein